MTLFHDSNVPPSAPAARRPRIPRPRAAALLLPVVVAALLLPACSGNRNPGRSEDQLRFGVDMARRGLWSEALFRFQEAQRLDPQSPRILNNLAVASEALGQFDTALEYYRRALQLDPNSREARANYSRFAEFYQSFRGPQRGAPRPGAPAPAGTPGSAPDTAPGAAPGEPAPADVPEPLPSGPVTPPGQAPIEPPTPPTGNVATPPNNEPPSPSPPPPASSPAGSGLQAFR
ncbi:MAG TPA: tetratricopeptide repeat protein [Thermoanaerobaculia bacterium]|nr:tetratricopeptide repeat protein [Thermoanaerobaculia bacterium]